MSELGKILGTVYFLDNKGRKTKKERKMDERDGPVGAGLAPPQNGPSPSTVAQGGEREPNRKQRPYNGIPGFGRMGNTGWQ